MGIFCLLIANDDFRCQHLASQVLQHCNYEELHTGKIMDALYAISEKKNILNPVLITNAHRLGEKGFQILNQIQTQLNFDIIYMTPDDDQMVELKRGEEISISAYAINISNLEDINCLWESANVKEKSFMNQHEETSAHMSIKEITEAASDDGDDDEESRTNQKRKRKETEELTEKQSQEGGSGGGDDHPVEKKPRVVWTKEMHRKFLEAIEILGPDKTFPKKIVELMNEPGLTRENVASHLQKYRLCLKRNQEEAAANCNNDLNNHHRPWFFSSSFQPFGFPYQQGSCGMISSMPSSLGLGLSRPFTTTSHGSSFPFTSFRISSNAANAAATAPWNLESVKSFIGLRFTTDGKSLEFGQTTTTTSVSGSGSGSGNSNEIQNEMFSSVGTTEIIEHSNFPEPPPNNNNDNNTIFGDCNNFEQEPFLPLLETSLPVPDDYCAFQQSHEEEPLSVLQNNNNNNNSSFLHEIPTSWNDDNSSLALPQQENGASMDEIAAAESVLSIVSTPPQENSFPVLLGGGTTTTIGFENVTFPFQESSVSSSTTPYQIPVQESSEYQIPVQESSEPLLVPSSVQDDDFDCFQLPVEDINSFLNETAECSNPQLFWKGVYDYAYHNSAC